MMADHWPSTSLLAFRVEGEQRRGGPMIRHHLRAQFLIGATAILGVAPLMSAQAPKAVALDRSAIPTAGKTPELHVPTWSKLSLANGARLVVSERHGLPLVYVSINFV